MKKYRVNREQKRAVRGYGEYSRCFGWASVRAGHRSGTGKIDAHCIESVSMCMSYHVKFE